MTSLLFVLSILAFLQMICIPGYIIVKFFRLKLESKIQTMSYCLALSLLFNYLVVYSLTVLKLYLPITIYLIMAVEGLFLIFIWKKSKRPLELCFDFERYLKIFKCVSYKKPLKRSSIFYFISLVISLLIIVMFIYIFFSRIKAVFYFSDPVLGWNRFALDWYHNQIPNNTWYYPQMIPANWSMAYIIVQNPFMQMLARNLMPLFPIFTTLLFFDLGLRKKNAVYYWGLIIYGTIIFYLYPFEFITSGHMDIAVSFFGFLSIYPLLLPPLSQSQHIQKSILSVLFACIASITKQAGLYILIIVVTMNLVSVIKENRRVADKSNKYRFWGAGTTHFFRIFIIFFIIISVTVFSWYVYRMILIDQGIESSGIKAVTQDVHQNRNLIQRIQFGFNRIINAKNLQNNSYFFHYLALLSLLFSLFKKESRYITLLVVIPFTLIWAVYFSYDYRNLTLVIPFASLSMAIGLSWGAKYVLNFFLIYFGRWRKKQNSVSSKRSSSFHIIPFACNVSFFKKIPRIHLKIWYILLSFITLMLILNFTIFKGSRIIENQLIQQQKVGNHKLNLKLYEYLNKIGFKGKIFSKYPYLRFLPMLKEYWAFERTDPQVYYFLEDISVTKKSIFKEIKQKLKTGEYKTLFSYKVYRFIQVKR